MLRIGLLGGFRLTHNDVPMTSFSTPRLQALLAYLVLHRENPQPRQHLAFLLWPDSAEAQARTNLRNLIHILRHALPHAEDFLCVDAVTLQWRVDSDFQLDVADFEKAIDEGRANEAITLYQGDLLPGCYDDWIISKRERLQQMYVEALHLMILEKENGRDYRAAIVYAHQLLRSEPLREEVYCDLMRLYALNGDRTGIVRAYHICTVVLRKELGLEPSAGTRVAYERCLQLSSTGPWGTGHGPSAPLDSPPNNLFSEPARPFGPEHGRANSESSLSAQHPIAMPHLGYRGPTSVLTVILAGGTGSRTLSILTEKRAKPALPFGGQYRLIDFPLSNAVNSDLHHIAVVTQYQPHTLIRHLGQGEPWNLGRDRSPSLEIWQPYRGRQDQGWYRGTADALYQNRDLIRESGSELVLIMAGDHVYKQDYQGFLRFHQDHQADLTIAMMPIHPEEVRRFGIISIDSEQRITQFIEKPTQSSSTLGSLGICIFNTPFLLKCLEEDSRDATSLHDFGMNIIPRVVEQNRAFAFPFSGYWVDIGSIAAYWEANLALLAANAALDLDDPNWIIRTRSDSRPPATCRLPGVIENSLVSNGCVIDGAVINSVLSPGVRVGRGAVVRDSVIMTDTTVEAGAWVERCILDKEVRIGAKAQLGMGHDNTPNQLEPFSLYAGITIVGKRAQVRAGALVGLNCRIDPDVTPEDFLQLEIPSGTTVPRCSPKP